MSKIFNKEFAVNIKNSIERNSEKAWFKVVAEIGRTSQRWLVFFEYFKEMYK